jgi:hypothetical protein
MKMVDGTILVPIGPPVWLTEQDLGLIPVGCPQNATPLAVSTHEPSLGLQLWGMSHREHGLVVGSCGVLEQEGESFLTSCDGTHGFSGTGYVNGHGILMAIHKGPRFFKHFGDEIPELDVQGLDQEFNSFEYQWKEVKKNCLKNNNSMTEECLIAWRIYIATAARNPRTKVESAHHLHDLSKQCKNFTGSRKP